jgi:hypothetical protein
MLEFGGSSREELFFVINESVFHVDCLHVSRECFAQFCATCCWEVVGYVKYETDVGLG